MHITFCVFVLKIVHLRVKANGLDKKRTSLAGAGGFTVGLFHDASVNLFLFPFLPSCVCHVIPAILADVDDCVRFDVYLNCLILYTSCLLCTKIIYI